MTLTKSHKPFKKKRVFSSWKQQQRVEFQITKIADFESKVGHIHIHNEYISSKFLNLDLSYVKTRGYNTIFSYQKPPEKEKF